ncbi:NAD(P)/FAD-dependent oxidoreductase [Caenispirillum bisanense]|uniref:NAD(P)/FAD-dependent oxidoreductase n=1 Tax=Caenispirillum bisanense TaxID=414052 RepID=UPI0031D769F7
MAETEPRVVIIGAGFGGLACAQALGGAPVRVTVVDKNNYHLFAPLLYQVATAALSPADIAEPIRRILHRHRNIDVRMGKVSGVDTAGRQVILSDGARLPYDRLVVATGSIYSYFGHEAEWQRHAPGLKTIENAREIRARLLYAFESAEAITDPEERRRLMTTVVVGGGPTGVEMAGAVAELCRYTLSRDFRHIDPRQARVLLIEAAPRILGPFPEDLARYAERALEAKGVKVVTGAMVDSIEADGVVVGGRRIPAGTIVWGAGVKAAPAAEWLGIEPAKGGRIAVEPDLSVRGLDGVYALGDVALAAGEDGAPLPGLAQVAKQQGEHLGRALAQLARDGTPVPAFRFRSRGNTAIVGRNAAIFDFGRRRLKGRLAWLLWAVVHVWLLVGFEKRMRVSFQWLWRWLTYQRGARIITREPPDAEKQL